MQDFISNCNKELNELKDWFPPSVMTKKREEIAANILTVAKQCNHGKEVKVPVLNFSKIVHPQITVVTAADNKRPLKSPVVIKIIKKKENNFLQNEKKRNLKDDKNTEGQKRLKN